MAVKADEIIKLRNEGMAYALKIAKENGLHALEEQVLLFAIGKSIQEGKVVSVNGGNGDEKN